MVVREERRQAHLTGEVAHRTRPTVMVEAGDNGDDGARPSCNGAPPRRPVTTAKACLAGKDGCQHVAVASKGTLMMQSVDDHLAWHH